MHHEQKDVYAMTKLLAFYVLQIWLYIFIFKQYFWERNFLTEIIIFELGSMVFYLLLNGVKYAVNFLEFITLSEFKMKIRLFLLSDLTIHMLKIIFQGGCLLRFALYYNYPVFWARDIFLSIMMSIDYVKKYYSSLKMARDLAKLPTVDLKGKEEVCGICMDSMTEGCKLVCGHCFHKECLL